MVYTIKNNNPKLTTKVGLFRFRKSLIKNRRLDAELVFDEFSKQNSIKIRIYEFNALALDQEISAFKAVKILDSTTDLKKFGTTEERLLLFKVVPKRLNRDMVCWQISIICNQSGKYLFNKVVSKFTINLPDDRFLCQNGDKITESVKYLEFMY